MTAAATTALAVLTATLAGFTAYLALKTRDAAKGQLDAAQRQLRASYRPMLIELLPSGRVPEDMGADQSGSVLLTFQDRHRTSHDARRPYVELGPGFAYIWMPLRNVGSGLAIVERDRLGIDGNAIGDVLEGKVRRARVPAGETTAVDFFARLKVGVGRTEELVVDVPYTDVGGEQRTIARATISEPDRGWYITDVSQVGPDV
jgi:hypothetical protein